MGNSSSRIVSVLGVLAAIAFAWAGMPNLAHAGVSFKISATNEVAPKPVRGRLFIGLIGPGSTLGPEVSPADAPFWFGREPMFAAWLKDFSSDTPKTLDDAGQGDKGERVLDSAGPDSAPIKLNELPPGRYRASARLIVNRQSSNWKHDAGNLFSEEFTFELPALDDRARDIVIDVPLTKLTKAREWPAGEASGGGAGAELFEITSKRLSAFHREPRLMRAGVVPPAGFDPASKRTYPAIYLIPGFGGDHFEALREAKARQARASANDTSPEGLLDHECFLIVLDPESPNGHTLFLDSENNGPCALALVTELIPELEKKYPLTRDRRSRVLRGHSSGGWSSLSLAVSFPQVFGATWSSSPDPVDFRAFQSVDITSAENMYRDASDPDANDAPSFRKEGKVVMTIRQENAGERLLGPHQTSGQQWASWMAAFGPRDRRGFPAALFDSVTGKLSPSVVDHFSNCDLTRQLRHNYKRYAPVYRDNVRLVVGAEDNFYLEKAVELLKKEYDRISGALQNDPEWSKPSAGYIKILPGYDHGTIFQSPELRGFPAEMLAYFAALPKGEAPVTSTTPGVPPSARE